jgi:hypothetical protein
MNHCFFVPNLPEPTLTHEHFDSHHEGNCQGTPVLNIQCLQPWLEHNHHPQYLNKHVYSLFLIYSSFTRASSGTLQSLNPNINSHPRWVLNCLPQIYIYIHPKYILPHFILNLVAPVLHLCRPVYCSANAHGHCFHEQWNCFGNLPESNGILDTCDIVQSGSVRDGQCV